MRAVLIIALASLLGLGQAAPLRAETPVAGGTTFFTTRDVLSSFFPHSEKVTFKTFELTAEQRARISRRLGYALPKSKYTIFVATTGDRVDGFSLVDEERGQHEPITFATRLSPRGVVEAMEIMVYREARGDEVRDPRFRKQFQGKSSQDPLRLNQDIDAVSGATISSASLTVGVRRAAILIDELAVTSSAFAQAAAPSAHVTR